MAGKRVRYDTASLPLNLEEFKSNLEIVIYQKIQRKYILITLRVLQNLKCSILP